MVRFEHNGFAVPPQQGVERFVGLGEGHFIGPQRGLGPSQFDGRLRQRRRRGEVRLQRRLVRHGRRSAVRHARLVRNRRQPSRLAVGQPQNGDQQRDR